MGTHPIFESDFDCLTDQIMNRQELEARSTDGKLNCQISCQFCPSKVLPPHSAYLVEETKGLPAFKTDEAEENVQFWWCVNDMWTFDNIGFSKAKDGIKFLTCADCEIGPLGYHDPSITPHRFLIAATRVKHA